MKVGNIIFTKIFYIQNDKKATGTARHVGPIWSTYFWEENRWKQQRKGQNCTRRYNGSTYVCVVAWKSMNRLILVRLYLFDFHAIDSRQYPKDMRAPFKNARKHLWCSSIKLWTILHKDRSNKGEKVRNTRFLISHIPEEAPAQSTSSQSSRSQGRMKDLSPRKSRFAKSISLADLLKAGKIVKMLLPERLSIEQFDINTMQWLDHGIMELTIDNESFVSGAFRDALKAKERDKSIWVLKNTKRGQSKWWVNYMLLTRSMLINKFKFIQ